MSRGVSGPTSRQVRRAVVTMYVLPGSRYYGPHGCRSDKRTPQHPRVQLAVVRDAAERYDVFHSGIYGRRLLTRGSPPFNLASTTTRNGYSTYTRTNSHPMRYYELMVLFRSIHLGGRISAKWLSNFLNAFPLLLHILQSVANKTND